MLQQQPQRMSPSKAVRRVSSWEPYDDADPANNREMALVRDKTGAAVANKSPSLVNLTVSAGSPATSLMSRTRFTKSNGACKASL